MKPITDKEVLHTQRSTSIDRFSIVKYEGKEWLLESFTNPSELQRIDETGKRVGKQINRNTELEVVKYPAQLAWDYLEAVNNYQSLLDSNRELLEALVNVTNWHRAHDQISFIEEQAIKDAETAINNAKNIK